MSRAATASSVSALLRRSGFQRSNYGDTGVMRDETTPGYTAWKSYHQTNPHQPFIAVMHTTAEKAWGDDEAWSAHVAECKEHLEKYAEAIRAAGYKPVVRDRGSEPPWLIILTVIT